MEFSVESLILAVQMRPELWDSGCERYKDRYVKRNGWVRVCREVIDDFEDMVKAEQLVIEKELMTKWRTVRDGYIKAKKRQQEYQKSGGASKRPHPYVYAKLLKFLDKILDTKQSEDGFGTSENNQTDDFDQNIDIKVEGACSDPPLPCENHEINRETSNVDVQFDTYSNNDRLTICGVQSLQLPRDCRGRTRKAGRGKFYRSRYTEEDEDLLFFKSLLSTVKKLNDSQKLDFRMRTLANLHSFIDQPAHPSDTRQSSLGVRCDRSPNDECPAAPPTQAIHNNPRPVSPSSESETGSSWDSMRESPNYNSKRKRKGAPFPKSSTSEDAE